MSKLKFDEYGNPMPYEIVRLSYLECEDIFVNFFKLSNTRQTNWNNFIKFHNDIESTLKTKTKHWLDGSFVTNKINPKDIDTITFVDETVIDMAFYQFDMNHSSPKSLPKIKYNIDNYVIFILPPTHMYYDIMKQRIDYWVKWFSSDREGNPKAIVEVE